MMTQAVHDRLMFAMRSLAGDLKVLSSMSETMAKIVSSIGFLFLFDGVRVRGVIMAKIVASNGEFGDEFGYSASMDGDYAVIGAPYDSVGGNYSQGSAYIFLRSGTSWNQQVMLTASDGATNDLFGRSVSISGDYALIGAGFDDIGGNSQQGSAYIFLRSGTSWTQQAMLTASDGMSGDHFGNSVSIDGDYALAGAIYDDIYQGSAYIFLRNGTDWSQQALLVAADGATNDQFGCSASLSGDYALIGAYLDDISDTDQGSAYIFLRSDTSWSQQAKLTASDGASDDNFGWSVAIDGDYAVIGSYGKDVSGNSEQGAAYVFMRAGTDWNQQAMLTASDGSDYDEFGSSVSLSGDYALIGAYLDDVALPDQGSAYIFMRSGSDWDEQTQLSLSNGVSHNYFGFSTTLDGEYAMIGANGYYLDQGAAYTYCWANQTWADCNGDMDDDDDDGSMMIGGVSILGLSLISLMMMM